MIPWLEEMRRQAEPAARCGGLVNVDSHQLLALIAIAEAAQEYSAPEFRTLVWAVEAAGRVE